MKTVFGLDDLLAAPGERTVVTIGNFDGVHRGHQAIIRTAREVAHREGAALVAMTFDPHPAAVLAPGREPPRLTTVEDRLTLFDALGVDAAVVLRSERRLLDRPALDFLNDLVQRCRPTAFVEGASFMFGRGRQGNVDMLAQHADRLGYSVTVVETYRCDALPDRPTVSSSAIRAELAAGRVERVAAMLGRPYRIAGVVGHGEHRGTNLGFPTANLQQIPHALPAEGVYAGRVRLAGTTADGGTDDSRVVRPAAVNVGRQPTFGGDTARVEAHVLDFSGDLRRMPLAVEFLRYLRSVRKFDDATALIAQIREDVEATRAASGAP